MAKHRIGTNGVGDMKPMILTCPSRNRSPGKRAMTKLLMILSVALVFLHVVSAGVQDAENGGECVDSDPVNCPFWAATGECKANRGYMHRHCKKSCDRCKWVLLEILPLWSYSQPEMVGYFSCNSLILIVPSDEHSYLVNLIIVLFSPRCTIHSTPCHPIFLLDLYGSTTVPRWTGLSNKRERRKRRNVK